MRIMPAWWFAAPQRPKRKERPARPASMGIIMIVWDSVYSVASSTPGMGIAGHGLMLPSGPCPCGGRDVQEGDNVPCRSGNGGEDEEHHRSERTEELEAKGQSDGTTLKGQWQHGKSGACMRPWSLIQIKIWRVVTE